MADQQQGAFVVQQQFFQQLQRFHVEVVGGFVHHQQIRWLRKQPCQQQTVALTTRQPGDRRTRTFRRKQKILQVADDVFAAAVDLHKIRAAGHILNRVAALIQLAAMLVEIGNLQLRALLHRAGIGRELTQQDFQQGGFSGTIRADDADLVAAQNHRAGIAQDDLAAKRLRHLGELDDFLARGLRDRAFHADLAGQLAAFGALVAHRF